VGLLRGVPFIQSFHYDKHLAQKVRELTAQEPYDILHLEFPFMAPYLSSISRQSRAKKVLSMHNVESLRFARELQVSSWNGRRLVLLGNQLFFRSWEEKAIRQFDGIAVVSAEEQTWVQRHVPAAMVDIVPNGVDIDYFATTEPSSGSRSIVFIGAMDYPPNVDAVVWFCQEILPLLHRKHREVCFTIVGDSPDRKVLALAQRQGVQVTGQVPDIRPYLADCVALVVPLRSGGGTRLKILQAMAMQRPVVSTHLGAEGLEAISGTHILMGDTTQELAQHLCAVLADPQLGARLGNAGRQLVETTYDWNLCLHRLDSLYETLISNPTMSRVLADVQSSADTCACS
jgi:glycosyltransferase involved in cell wall biosynthesis